MSLKDTSTFLWLETEKKGLKDIVDINQVDGEAITWKEKFLGSVFFSCPEMLLCKPSD